MKQTINGAKQSKKPTAAQLERRLANAIVLVEKTKDTKSIFFSDKGLRLTVNEDYVVIATNFHQHVFQKITLSGISRPYLYTERFLELALGNDCMVKDNKGNDIGYSYAKLMDVLKKKDDQTEYNIAQYVDWWFSIIFAPLYSIDTNAASQFNVYFKYLSHIATQHIFLSEHKEGMTNKQFVDEHGKLMSEFLENMTETPIFEALTDEQRMKQEMEAMQEQEVEQEMKKEANNE